MPTPWVLRSISHSTPTLTLLALVALAGCPSPTPSDGGASDGATDIVPADAPDAPDAPAGCDALCADAASRCAGTLDAAACLAACAPADAGAGGVATVRACLQSASLAASCSAARACLRPPPAVPFSAGPYGTYPRDIAGPFTLPTTDGDWAFRDEWTGADNYVFLVYAPGAVRFGNGTDYSVALFGGSLAELLAASPPNTHYVFLWLRNQPDFDAFRDGALGELATLAPEDQTRWRPRVHFVTTRADLLEGWAGDLVRARLRSTDMVKRYEPYQWAIDRTQHVREVGQLGRLVSGGLAPELPFAASESVYYNFEYQREQALAARPATVVQLLRDESVVETAYPEVALPDPATMATFDTLEVDLTMNCVNHRDGDCGAWDYISDLRLCEAGDGPSGDAGASDGSAFDGASPSDDAAPLADAASDDATADAATDATTGDAGPPPPRCDTEIARWITSYWREGRWVTDISSMLPLLRAGGRQRFRWYASRQWDPRPANYVVSLALRFSNRARGMRPVEVRPLYPQGGALNDGYNAAHPPVSFEVPAGVRRVEVYALVTGHGSQTAQCAEFCNHTHHFAVNGGVDHALRFPEAQSPDGCRARVDAGVVPNQHGTWYFGRGGWCPGGDVPPFVADVTADLHPGAVNTLTYTAMIGSTPPAPGRSYGNIDLSAYLVLWQ